MREWLRWRVVFSLMATASLVAGAGCSQNGYTPPVPGTGAPGGGPAGGGRDGGATTTTGADGSTGPSMRPESCKHADVIISVDDSGSMSEEIEAMRSTIFPAFAERLLAIGVGLDDFRVGALDACPDPDNLHTRGRASECSFASGKPWMESTNPSLVSEFGCVGDIYNGDMRCSGDNDDEQPASAAAAALEASAPGGVNEGFVRDDALLVVIAITDEDEQPVPRMTPDQVYDRLVAVKGAVHRMVFLGIGGASDCHGVYGGADEAVRLKQITQRFADAGRGVFWDLCGGRLEDGLDEAFAVIERACEDLPRCDEFGAGVSEDCYPPPPPPSDPADGGLF